MKLSCNRTARSFRNQFVPIMRVISTRLLVT